LNVAGGTEPACGRGNNDVPTTEFDAPENEPPPSEISLNRLELLEFAQWSGAPRISRQPE
jgi:hypothetical protein